MRRIDNEAIRAAGEIRFRSEYDYAVFEYVRSSKVIQSVERSGVKLKGRVLDAGCGSGGTAKAGADDGDFLSASHGACSSLFLIFGGVCPQGF